MLLFEHKVADVPDATIRDHFMKFAGSYGVLQDEYSTKTGTLYDFCWICAFIPLTYLLILPTLKLEAGESFPNYAVYNTRLFTGSGNLEWMGLSGCGF